MNYIHAFHQKRKSLFATSKSSLKIPVSKIRKLLHSTVSTSEPVSYTHLDVYKRQVCRKGADGNESRAYLRIHESEKTGKNSGKTRLEYSQIFVDFEKNKKKRSFKRKMVLGITPKMCIRDRVIVRAIGLLYPNILDTLSNVTSPPSKFILICLLL